MVDGILREKAMKSKATFTKRDVLVVSGCLVFLLGGLGAVGGGGRRRAKEAVCASNLRRWGVIWKAFVDDEVRNKTTGEIVSRAGFFMGRRDAVYWLETVIKNYAASQEPKLWLCPEATKVGALEGYFRPEGALNPHAAWDDVIDFDGNPDTTFPHPDADPGSEYYVKASYVINLWVSKYDDGRYWRTPYIRGAEYGPLLLDGQWKDMQPYPTDTPSPLEELWWTAGPAHEMRRACLSRHNGAVNALFLDFSVRKVGLKELWELEWHRNWNPDNYPPPVWPGWMENFKDYWNN
jgi:prepilin-type processing-associated H-X9-DG protein